MQLLTPERAKRSSSTDKIDSRILHVLQRDGRISNLKLAEEVHLSPTAVLERVRRLQRDGFILGYQARLNAGKLGMGLVAFVEVLLDRTGADVMDTFKDAVQQRPEIHECHLIAGSFDYLLKVRVADNANHHDAVAGLVRSLPGVRSSRIYSVTEQVEHRGGVSAETPLDVIDAQLLRLLQADGRISISRLAEEVGVAPATAHERVGRLRRQGFILGYEAVLNQAKLSSGLVVFAEIRVADASPGIRRTLKAAVQACDDVIECHEVAGSFDCLIKTRVPDMQRYRELVESAVWSLPGVREVRTYAVIEEVKNTARIPL